MDGQHVQGLQALASCCLQERATFFGVERLDLLSRSTYPRRLHAGRGVARDQAVRDGLRECLTQHDMHLFYRRRREVRTALLPVEATHMSRGEALEFYVSECRADVFAGDVGVVGVGGLLDRAFHRVREPPIQVLPDRELAGVVDEPAVSIRHRFRELARGLRPRLSRYRAPLAPFGGADAV